MHKKIAPFLLGLSLAGAYILGCATSSYVEPPAAAQQQYTPPVGHRWAYFCTEGRNAQTINERANAAGAEGWEMVTSGVDRLGIWCFKRAY
jgi:hypothetical protein